MTYTRRGGRQARSTVFSRLVWLTQMTACASASVNFSALFSAMDAGSAKPTSEWSVNSTCT